jgi:tetratricopeptide (TPR) repeat protein
MHLQKYSQALSCYGKALSMTTKKRHQVLLHFGICYLREGQYQKALQTLNQCLQAHHTFAEVSSFF